MPVKAFVERNQSGIRSRSTLTSGTLGRGFSMVALGSGSTGVPCSSGPWVAVSSEREDSGMAGVRFHSSRGSSDRREWHFHYKGLVPQAKGTRRVNPTPELAWCGGGFAKTRGDMKAPCPLETGFADCVVIRERGLIGLGEPIREFPPGDRKRIIRQFAEGNPADTLPIGGPPREVSPQIA